MLFTLFGLPAFQVYVPGEILRPPAYSCELLESAQVRSKLDYYGGLRRATAEL